MPASYQDLTTPITGPDNRIHYRCWTGVGDNSEGLPRCTSFLQDGTDTGGAGGAGGSIASGDGVASDQVKIQGLQKWETAVALAEPNSGGGSGIGAGKKPLEPAQLKELYIEEDVFSFFSRGYLVTDSWHEGVEREGQKPAPGVETWTFRNDGRDEFNIKIIPRTQLDVNVKDLPPEVWSFETNYVIYDKEDLGQDYDEKIKKFYFWDKNYQLMQERKIQWSTATGTRFYTPSPKEPLAHATDLERSMPTGEALASVLWDAGFDEYIDFDNWDLGGSSIYYTAKTDDTVLDVINYILSKHVSKEHYDICMFIRNRYTRKYQLRPYYKIFEDAGKGEPGPLQREHLFFEETGEGKYQLSDFIDESVISPWKAPLLNAISYDIDIKSNEWGFITNYYFTDMAGIDSSIAMVSKPVHTHWNKKNQFIMNAKNNEIEKTREDFIKPYRIDKVLGDYPLYTLNKTKKDQIAISHRYSLDSTLDPEKDVITRLVNGRNETVFANLFLNQVFAMQMMGSTHREAGMFIGIDRHGWSDNDFDYKMCGQWFVTSVIHNFLHEKYTNKVTMVKLHAFKKFKKAPKEDIV